MRILEVLEASSNSSVYNSQTWLRNLYEPLLDLGHEVVLFSITEGRVAMQRRDTQARDRFSEKLLAMFHREHRRKPFDLFFGYFMDGMVEPRVIDEIRRSGVPTCNFSCNNIHQFDLVDELSPHFDFSLHAEKEARKMFLSIGAHPIWWPMASNPKYFRPLDLPLTFQASFVGANYALRARYIAHLLENGVDAHAFGPGWRWGASTKFRSHAKHYKSLWRAITSVSAVDQSTASAELADHDFRRALAERFPRNVHPIVSDEELIELYSRSHVSLGFLEVYNRHDPSATVTQHVHLREFEAPMCGALYCTGYMDELAEMFDPDKEVIMYRSNHELLDKVRFYLANPVEAAKIRRAGRKKALTKHTYHVRFQELWQKIEL